MLIKTYSLRPHCVSCWTTYILKDDTRTLQCQVTYNSTTCFGLSAIFNDIIPFLVHGPTEVIPIQRTCLRLPPKTAITSKQFETVRLAALYGHVATYPSCQWTLCHSCKHPRRSRCPRGLRPLACWGCGFESRRGDMEIEVCASDRSLVQRSPTEWICVTECDQVH